MSVRALAPTTPTADPQDARRQDADAFERLVLPHRRELQAHCYRMLGAIADAEDAVQETMVRAWRGLAGFEGRSSLRSWLYAIATNVCLKAIERRSRRVLPVDIGPPAHPHAPLGVPVTDVPWLEPYPDAALGDEAGPASPEARYEQRESVELAFLAALQHLPARQRAVLLLRDVLGFTPSEIAAALDASPAAVSSVLQRAHEAVRERLPDRSQQETLRSIGDARLREVVKGYMRAWEEGDVGAIKAMLTDDATLDMPPRPEWYRGRDAVTAFLAAQPLAGPSGPCRRWRFLPAAFNGQPAFATYARERPGEPAAASCIQVLTLAGEGRIAAVTAFNQPALFARFGLPAALPPTST